MFLAFFLTLFAGGISSAVEKRQYPPFCTENAEEFSTCVGQLVTMPDSACVGSCRVLMEQYAAQCPGVESIKVTIDLACADFPTPDIPTASEEDDDDKEGAAGHSGGGAIVIIAATALAVAALY